MLSAVLRPFSILNLLCIYILLFLLYNILF